MVTKSSGMTMREHQLSKELERIRSTYSFNLGLLLTEAFVRKPWKLPLLPFLFIKLNLDFLKNRNATKREIEERTTSFDPNCLLLFSTSEEGTSSLERCSVLARQWQEMDERKVVIITSQQELNSVVPQGAIVYPLTDPKEISKDQRSSWNARCEQLLSNILDTHHPANVLFDGPYPYRGVLNCMQQNESISWYWIRPEGVKDGALTARSSEFTSIVEFGFSSNFGVQLVEPTLNHVQVGLNKQILDARSYGSRSPPKFTKTRLQELVETSANFVELEEWYDSNEGLLHSRETPRLLAAILPPNIEAISVMMENNVPTLCIYNDDVDAGTIRKIREGTQRSAVLFAHENDEIQFKLALNSLVNQHQIMRRTSSPVKKRSWVNQILSNG
jgi:hypothetical protein